MNRRTVLSALGAGVPLITGCVSQGGGTTPSSSSADSITNESFRILGPDSGPEDPSKPPRVTFDSGANQVRVTGRLWVGSEKCKEAKLESIVYNAAKDHLSVVVTDGKSDSHPDNQPLGIGSCDDAMSSDGYEGRITFKEGLPEGVTATERDADGNTQSTSATPDDAP